MVCSRRCIVVTIYGALYNVDVDIFKYKIIFKYLMDTIDINKHDINIFINDAGDIGRLFKITRRLELRF